MERELWPSLYRLLREVGDAFRQSDVTYQPWVVVAVLLWAALHDRSRGWACQLRHWSTTRRRPGRLPSEATISPNPTTGAWRRTWPSYSGARWAAHPG